MTKLNITLLLLPIAIFFSSCAQTKVYAYAQPVIGGVNPQGAVDESGNKVEGKPRSTYNHYFYMRHSRNKEIQPVAIMIGGKAWQVTSHPVDSNEVYITDVKFPANPEKVVLVPETNKKILSLQIDYSRPFEKVPADLTQKIVSPSAVIFFYKKNNKTRYKELDKITMLAPVATM
jgi:hypothetical protein